MAWPPWPGPSGLAPVAWLQWPGFSGLVPVAWQPWPPRQPRTPGHRDPETPGTSGSQDPWTPGPHQSFCRLSWAGLLPLARSSWQANGRLCCSCQAYNRISKKVSRVRFATARLQQQGFQGQVCYSRFATTRFPGAGLLQQACQTESETAMIETALFQPAICDRQARVMMTRVKH